MFFWVKSSCELVGRSQREAITSALKMETARFSETLASTNNPYDVLTRKNVIGINTALKILNFTQYRTWYWWAERCAYTWVGLRAFCRTVCDSGTLKVHLHMRFVFTDTFLCKGSLTYFLITFHFPYYGGTSKLCHYDFSSRTKTSITYVV
jgi:hypothetical protein